jgi:hypothetical protein
MDKELMKQRFDLVCSMLGYTYFDVEWVKRNIMKITREDEIKMLRKKRIEKLNQIYKNDM